MLRAGKTEYLKVIRGMLDAKETNEEQMTVALLLMGDYAEAQDVPRLTRLLDSEPKVVAAMALLRYEEKKQVKEE